MPELPDITVYVEAIDAKVRGEMLKKVVLRNPFLLRTVVPSIADIEGKCVLEVRRLGKRVVLALEGDLFLIIHLMIAGRLRWIAPTAKSPDKIALALFQFANGTLVLTEAGSKRRASLHIVKGKEALCALDPGGAEIFALDVDAFAVALRKENRTLKRALTDPKTFSGIGNSYSDEILHRAKLSPIALSQKLSDEEMGRLFAATRNVLSEWTERLRKEAGDFPTNVTAFRPEMAVHGKYDQPCPVCGAPVQRIVYAENECNYCARCQTGGKLLADRSLSRLLKASWPKSIDELG
jgi:formamidopyrimidine-DNA glycosylase